MAGDPQAERQRKDDAVRTSIMQKLVETGEKERLKELLRQKLIECGWRDELKEYCKEVIRNKGLEKITVDELVAEITPRGRATVPDEVKTELLQRIRKFLQVT
ncbi:transcription factor e(y)2-domain-containing protein [Pelagophyceae sp. CCMP2097]|nr:transcription factor e(y)2-domain-containing protein [Pelagophyceae sp. CCMP2097]